MRATFYTVANSRYFIGLVGLVNFEFGLPGTVGRL